MRYAYLKDGRVENLIWLSASNAMDFPNAVPVGNVPVQMGDTYANGAFYRGGEKLLTPDEENRMLLEQLMGGVEDVRQE